ncbi:MAG TPA: class I SAM-dependent methyltransferase [Patescibacteria group bacterium]|nr:class I SAM-dependent methyltransferase [Patescibacteria group bacterium]
MNLLYERYHSKRKTQKRVISDNDFTYLSILKLLQKYGIKDKDILDIGCGVGTIDLYLAKNGAKVFGIDISHKGIIIAKENAKKLHMTENLEFKVFNFPYKIPLAKYDIIICSEILEHIKDDKLAVKKMVSLLRPKGIIIASSPSYQSLLYRYGKLKKFDEEVGHLRRYNERSYKSLFINVGLRIKELKKIQGFLRDFLFTNKIGGFLLRFINKWPFSIIFTFLDDLTIPFFGESNIILVAQRK